ncbi:hypothetical protein B0H63DRAFT_165272 [Podospora didyma]|uniref:Uncharacterized protein n=1 Tax=Podospora didyma TaxID=330526 RepID=A0AAE0U1W0_9PEZI|nr:hypothetical protein B0H63DRAFT_165272 [Podospora didyma]
MYGGSAHRSTSYRGRHGCLHPPKLRPSSIPWNMCASFLDSGLYASMTFEATRLIGVMPLLGILLASPDLTKLGLSMHKDTIKEACKIDGCSAAETICCKNREVSFFLALCRSYNMMGRQPLRLKSLELGLGMLLDDTIEPPNVNLQNLTPGEFDMTHEQVKRRAHELIQFADPSALEVLCIFGSPLTVTITSSRLGIKQSHAIFFVADIRSCQV